MNTRPRGWTALSRLLPSLRLNAAQSRIPWEEYLPPLEAAEITADPLEARELERLGREAPAISLISHILSGDREFWQFLERQKAADGELARVARRADAEVVRVLERDLLPQLSPRLLRQLGSAPPASERYRKSRGIADASIPATTLVEPPPSEGGYRHEVALLKKLLRSRGYRLTMLFEAACTVGDCISAAAESKGTGEVSADVLSIEIAASLGVSMEAAGFILEWLEALAFENRFIFPGFQAFRRGNSLHLLPLDEDMYPFNPLSTWPYLFPAPPLPSPMAGVVTPDDAGVTAKTPDSFGLIAFTRPRGRSNRRSSD